FPMSWCRRTRTWRSRPRRPPATTRRRRPSRATRPAPLAARSTRIEPPVWSSIPVRPDTAAAISLLSADAVRQRAQRMLAIGLEDGLVHFRIDLARLDEAADLVAATTLEAYPTLDVPFHSRWRHFVLGSEDRWAAIDNAALWDDAAERARAAFDLAIASVLLDAGAGAQWGYRDPATGARVGRSEGLALASLAMFADGALSARPGFPLRADAKVLVALT